MKSAKSPTVPASRLTHSVEISTLCAFYGGLLTERQRVALQLHFDEDWSLAEVADHLEVSRQSVHDLITRSVQKLQRYEEAVGCAAQAQRLSESLEKAASEMEAALAHSSGKAETSIRQGLEIIRQITRDIEGEE